MDDKAGRRVAALALLGWLVTAPAGAQGLALNGSALIAGTSTDAQGFSSERLDQQYSVELLQPLTPFLRLRVAYDFFDLTTSFDDGLSVGRRSRRPQLELSYDRPGLSGRFTILDQAIDTVGPGADSFDRRSLHAAVDWRPRWGPRLGLNYRDESNVADVSVVGRGAETRLLELTALYSRHAWTASYRLESTTLENRSNALRSDQRRHEVRAAASPALLQGRLAFGLSAQYSRLGRSSEVGAGAELAEPIPAVAGLFAIDISPELGELDAHPGLVDGDIAAPAVPVVEIGGASTYRNIGLDLGVTRPVSRLEIAVDTLSGAQLAWQVFHSRDNLVWEAVDSVDVAFDASLLRYGLRFPRTEDRFFKAVNVSANLRPVVRVTEIRALLDLSAEALLGQELSDRDLYSADLLVRARPHPRVEAAAGIGLSNDQAVTAGLVRRDFRESHAFARMNLALARALGLRLSYRLNDSENRAGTPLARTVNNLAGALDWNPLPSVQALLAVAHQEESERGEPLQSLDTIRLGAVTDLLPELRLVSDLDRSRLADPFAQRDRVTWTLRETLELRLLPSWRVDGSFSRASSSSPDGTPLLTRSQYRLLTTWAPTAYLSFGGSWWVSLEGGRRSLNQSYQAAYARGNKLTLAATYQGLTGDGLLSTATDSLGATYRLFARLQLFATLSRSTSEDAGSRSVRFTDFRTGGRLSF